MNRVPQEKTCFLKMASRLSDYFAITGDFERFYYFNFETYNMKNESLFKKAGVRYFS